MLLVIGFLSLFLLFLVPLNELVFLFPMEQNSSTNRSRDRNLICRTTEKPLDTHQNKQFRPYLFIYDRADLSEPGTSLWHQTETSEV